MDQQRAADWALRTPTIYHFRGLHNIHRKLYFPDVILHSVVISVAAQVMFSTDRCKSGRAGVLPESLAGVRHPHLPSYHGEYPSPLGYKTVSTTKQNPFLYGLLHLWEGKQHLLNS